MRHTDIEEEIVQRGVHQRECEEEPPVSSDVRLERTPTATGYRKNNQTCRSKADARKEHLAASHVCRDAKGIESNLDERECPSPCYSRSQGKHHHPSGSLKYGFSRLFHLSFQIGCKITQKFRETGINPSNPIS